MGRVLPKPVERLEAIGDDSEGPRTYKSNGAVPGRNTQGGSTVNVTLCKRELGGDQGDAQGPNGIPPYIGSMDHRDDGKTWDRRIVGVSNGIGGDGLCGDPPHWIIHKEAADNHSVEGGLPACICTVRRGKDNSGVEPYGAPVGSRRSK